MADIANAPSTIPLSSGSAAPILQHRPAQEDELTGLSMGWPGYVGKQASRGNVSPDDMAEAYAQLSATALKEETPWDTIPTSFF